MSANNQTLIVKHDDTFYVYENVMAESWDVANTLDIKNARGVSTNFKEAYELAEKIEQEDGTEYGIWFDELAKNGAKVIIK